MKPPRCAWCGVPHGTVHLGGCRYTGAADLYPPVPTHTDAELAGFACEECGRSPVGGWTPWFLDDEGRCPRCSIEAGRPEVTT